MINKTFYLKAWTRQKTNIQSVSEKKHPRIIDLFEIVETTKRSTQRHASFFDV